MKADRISDYGFGHITIDGQSRNADVIVTPEAVIDNWWRREGHRLQVNDLDAIVQARPDLLIVGTGYYGRMQVPEQTKTWLQQQDIEVRQARTTDAVAEFNRLQKEYARIVAALHLTC